MSEKKRRKRYDSKNRRTFLKAAGGAAAVGLAGYPGGAKGHVLGTAVEEATLHLLTALSDPDSREAFSNAFEDWESSIDTNVDSQFEYVGFDDLGGVWDRYMQTGSPPDLALLSPSDVLFWQDELADLSEVDVDPQEDLSITYEGKLIGFPHRTDVENAHQWIRRDVFEDAGVEIPDVAPPEEMAWTFDEYRQIADQVQSHIDDEGLDMFQNLTFANGELGVMQNNYDQDWLMRESDYLAYDGEGDPEVIMDQEEHRDAFIDGMSYRQELYQYSPDSTNYEWGDNISVFVTEQVAQTHYSGRLLNNTYDGNPDIVDDIVAMPNTLPPEFETYQGPQANTLYTVPEEGNSDLAISFVDHFINTEHYIESLMAVPLHYLPGDLDLLFESETFQQHEWAPDHERYIEFIREVHPTGLHSGERTEAVLPTWGAIVNDPAPRMMARAIAGRTSVEEALDQGAEAMRTNIEELH